MQSQFEFTYRKQNGSYIEVEGKGDATAKDIEDMYRVLHDMAKQWQINKLLVDARKIALNYPMSEFVPLMKTIMPILAPFKIGRLVSEEALRQELVQTITGKSGINLKNFTCRNEALNWLNAD